jgi:hypothetical protein
MARQMDVAGAVVRIGSSPDDVMPGGIRIVADIPEAGARKVLAGIDTIRKVVRFMPGVDSGKTIAVIDGLAALLTALLEERHG